MSWRGCLPGSAVEMEGAPCTWLWREMPLSAPGMRPGVARTTHGLPSREAGACSSGEGETLPGGDRAGWASPGLGEGMAGLARGMEGTRTRLPPGEPRHPRRRREGTPIRGGGRWLPIDYSWQGAGSCLGARQLGGGVGIARRGGRVSRRELWGRAPGARAVGAARLGACRDGLRGLRLPEAAVGDDAPAADAGGLRSRGPSGRSAPGSGRSPGAASRRRAAVGLPRGPGSTSRSRGGGQGWAASGCTRGAPRPRVTEARPCCRFLREPRLGGGGRGGRLRSRHRPALAPPGAHWRAVGGGARGPSPAGRGRGPVLRK